MKRWAAIGFAMVMRARAAAENSKTIVQRRERAERIGHAALKPADHSRAHAAQDGAASPRVAQRAIDAMNAPYRKHVRGISAADVDHILPQQMLARIANVL